MNPQEIAESFINGNRGEVKTALFETQTGFSIGNIPFYTSKRPEESVRLAMHVAEILRGMGIHHYLSFNAFLRKD